MKYILKAVSMLIASAAKSTTEFVLFTPTSPNTNATN